jgi:hypothetical protein
MSYHKRAWAERFGELGDTAEAVFDLVYPKSHNLGLSRPPFSVSGMPAELRYTPDRMLRDRFVEVMGFGHDRLLKLKTEKLEALQVWTQLGQVDLFVFDQKLHHWFQAPINDWCQACEKWGDKDMFPEGKEYWALHASKFPADPTPVPHET